MKPDPHMTLEDELVHEVWRQDLSAVQCLLSSGANPNLPGYSWSSAIACAGENDDKGDIVRALVAAGANINLQCSRGLTPLHHAVDVAIDGASQAGRETIDWSAVQVFLDLGANPLLRDARGETVFDLASVYGEEARRSFKQFMDQRSDAGE